MRTIAGYMILMIITLFFITGPDANAQRLDDFKYAGPPGVMENKVRRDFQFNGYTNHWWNDYRIWSRYGNLYKISIPDVEKKIVQSKIDVAEDLQIPGLWIQEGFINSWLSSSVEILDNPSLSRIESAVQKTSVLVTTDPGSATGKALMSKYTGHDSWRQVLKSYQFDDPGYIVTDLFVLENGTNKIFVVSSPEPALRNKAKALLENVRHVVDTYDMHKGWFSVETLRKSVTCSPGHPLELIGKGMNEGNDWFVFNGYMEFLGKEEYQEWIDRSGMPIVIDMGHSPMFGLDDYDGLQVQDMPTKQSWIDFARKKNGYI